MPFFKLANPKLWISAGIAVLVLIAAAWCANFLIEVGENRVQIKWDAEKAEMARQSDKLKDEKTEKDRAAQNAIDEERKAKNAQIAKLNNNLATALAGLHNRPDRPGEGDLSKGTGPGGGCTGADLYRADAAFLTRETFRAEKLRIKLASCEADYAKVKRELNGE